MDTQLDVEYLQGDTTVRRTMNQLELASLLLDKDVVLLLVNKPQYRKYKKKAVNTENERVIPFNR